MYLSAEVRWFWRDHCPAETESWFRRGPTSPAIAPSGGEPRIDVYFHNPGQTELGIKARGARPGEPDDMEIKGLVAVLAPSELPRGDAVPGPAQIWCKWKAPGITGARSIIIRKQRWMRQYRVAGGRVEELPLDGNAQWPDVGCNLELTRVEIGGGPDTWWTLGFEAFGDLETTPHALVATFEAINPLPDFGGACLSYPEWLDRQ